MEKFYSAIMQAYILYGVELKEETAEELGLTAWKLIGNKNVRLYTYTADIDCETLSVQLPCNCDVIEAVTYNHEDWRYATNLHVNGDYNSQFTEEYIETRKLYNHPLYINGKYARYRRVGDTLYFDDNYGSVNILYKGIQLDDDGLPELNDKEVLAIATYIAFASRQKLGWMTHNQAMIQEAQYMYQQWQKFCDSARVPNQLTQNDMDEILNTKSSWGRKTYGKSFKPMLK